MLFQQDSPTARPLLPVPGPAWFISEIGVSQSLRSLREWRPDIIYTHAMSNACVERAISETPPAVLFAHDYSAIRISGSKHSLFRLNDGVRAASDLNVS